MLIQPDKLRKCLMLIFGGLFLILAIQVRFNLLFIHVMNDGAELATRDWFCWFIDALLVGNFRDYRSIWVVLLGQL